VAAAQYGRHNSKRESYGHSLVVDPWGTVVCDGGGCDGSGTTMDGDRGIESSVSPSVLFCDIDLSMVHTIRQQMPIQDHRRSALSVFHVT
jgi:deaminated glutathione amidase